MLSDSVAQNPTIAVRPGRNTWTSHCPPEYAEGVTRLDEWARIVPSPPAAHIAQPSSARPTAIRNGAAKFSSHLIDSVPRHTNTTLISQKPKKVSQLGR